MRQRLRRTSREARPELAGWGLLAGTRFTLYGTPRETGELTKLPEWQQADGWDGFIRCARDYFATIPAES